MPYSTAGKNLVLDSGLPATVYQGLSSTLPTVGGTNITEPSGFGYARDAFTAGAAAAGERSNTTATAFLASGGDWGTQVYSVYFTALTGGTFIGWSALSASRNMVDGASMDFPIGDIDFPLT